MTLEEMEKRLKATEDALKNLEKRVRVTEDINEIKQLQRRYVNALICTEWDDAVDCFAKNAKIDVYLHKPLGAKRQLTSGLKRSFLKPMLARRVTLLYTPLSLLMVTRPRGSGFYI